MGKLTTNIWIKLNKNIFKILKIHAEFWMKEHTIHSKNLQNLFKLNFINQKKCHLIKNRLKNQPLTKNLKSNERKVKLRSNRVREYKDKNL